MSAAGDGGEAVSCSDPGTGRGSCRRPHSGRGAAAACRIRQNRDGLFRSCESETARSAVPTTRHAMHRLSVITLRCEPRASPHGTADLSVRYCICQSSRPAINFLKKNFAKKIVQSRECLDQKFYTVPYKSDLTVFFFVTNKFTITYDGQLPMGHAMTETKTGWKSFRP